MSRNKDKIIKTLAKYGLEAKEIDYQPLGPCFEMCGPEGGWLVETTTGEMYLAYNINELINNIETDKGNYTDIKMIQKYCNHVPYWKNQYNHSEGSFCAICKKDLGE
jgi:hypothetical protein